MKRWIIVLLLLASAPAFGKAPAYRLAVLDFNISTTDESHRFVGKGFAEILSFELGSDESIAIIDRTVRNEALKEIKFSLTGLVNNESLLEVGSLLTANYLVTGTLVEMDRRYLISVNLLNVETAEIIWQDQLLTQLRNYDAISNHFAESLIAALVDVNDAATQIAFDESNAALLAGMERPDALIAFSTAIDAIDSGDNELARVELGKARAADPKNRVIDYYLGLISVVSPRFKFELRPFGPSYNPAYLPRMNADKFYVWEVLPFAFLQESLDKQITPEISTYESEVVINAGYLAPLGDRHGIDVSASWTQSINQSTTTVPYTFRSVSDTSFWFSPSNWSLNLGYGFAPSERLSVGFSFQPIIATWDGTSSSIGYNRPTVQFGVTAGFLMTFFAKRLLWDYQMAYSFYPQLYAIEADQEFYEGWVPLQVETSMIGGLIPDVLYASLKSSFDIYLDSRGGVFTKIVPMVEYHPAEFFAFKTGYLFSLLTQVNDVVVGHGVNAGLILSFGKWELDAAYSYANTPITNVPGYITPLSKLHFGLTRTGNFIGK